MKNRAGSLRIFMLSGGRPKKYWPDPYLELVEQTCPECKSDARCPTMNMYWKTCRSMHLMWGLVGFSDPIYLHVNTTTFCSNIIALSIGVSVDPLQAGRHPYFLPYYRTSMGSVDQVCTWACKFGCLVVVV